MSELGSGRGRVGVDGWWCIANIRHNQGWCKRNDKRTRNQGPATKRRKSLANFVLGASCGEKAFRSMTDWVKQRHRIRFLIVPWGDRDNLNRTRGTGKISSTETVKSKKMKKCEGNWATWPQKEMERTNAMLVLR